MVSPLTFFFFLFVPHGPSEGDGTEKPEDQADDIGRLTNLPKTTRPFHEKSDRERGGDEEQTSNRCRPSRHLRPTLVVVIQEKQKDQGWNEQSDESCPVSEGDHPRQLSERDPDLDDQDSEQRQDGEDAFQVYGGPAFLRITHGASPFWLL